MVPTTTATSTPSPSTSPPPPPLAERSTGSSSSSSRNTNSGGGTTTTPTTYSDGIILDAPVECYYVSYPSFSGADASPNSLDIDDDSPPAGGDNEDEDEEVGTDPDDPHDPKNKNSTADSTDRAKSGSSSSFLARCKSKNEILYKIAVVGAIGSLLALLVGMVFISIAAVQKRQQGRQQGLQDQPPVPTTSYEDLKDAQKQWLHLISGGGGADGDADGSNRNSTTTSPDEEEFLRLYSTLPPSVAESILLYPTGSPQVKALRWLAINTRTTGKQDEEREEGADKGTTTTSSTTASRGRDGDDIVACRTSRLPVVERYALGVLYYHWSGNLWNIPDNEWLRPSNYHYDGIGIGTTTNAPPAATAATAPSSDTTTTTTTTSTTTEAGTTRGRMCYSPKNSSSTVIVDTTSTTVSTTTTTTIECAWTGIVCNKEGTTVIGLNMSNPAIFTSLQGTTIPSELGFFANLQELIVPGHGLIGKASSILDLTNLRVLDLHSNSLTSVIPYLLPLEGLEHVQISYNMLRDVITFEDLKRLRKLRQIRTWYMNQNLDLTSYKDMEVPQYSFFGYAAGAWRYLEEIDVSYTNVYFLFPNNQMFLTWPQLSYLNARNSPLEGTIPISIAGLQYMRYFNVGMPMPIPALSSTGDTTSGGGGGSFATNATGLVGAIPPQFGHLTMLEFLGLSGNSLESTIPTELGMLTNLRELDLRTNFGIIGTIPTRFGNLRSIRSLYLSDTRLSGQVPSELGQCTDLQYAEFHHTRLMGSIPSEICQLEFLLQLYADCPIEGGRTKTNMECDCCTFCFG